MAWYEDFSNDSQNWDEAVFADFPFTLGIFVALEPHDGHLWGSVTFSLGIIPANIEPPIVNKLLPIFLRALICRSLTSCSWKNQLSPHEPQLP